MLCRFKLLSRNTILFGKADGRFAEQRESASGRHWSVTRLIGRGPLLAPNFSGPDSPVSAQAAIRLAPMSVIQVGRAGTWKRTSVSAAITAGSGALPPVRFRGTAPRKRTPLLLAKRAVEEGQHLAPATFGGSPIVDRKVRLHPAMRRGISLGPIADACLCPQRLASLLNIYSGKQEATGRW